MPKYWLLKSEPEVYSIDDLSRDKRTFWDGVRNHAARNFMRDEMAKGDLAFFYHSNAAPSGVAGIVEIVSKGKPDPSQFVPGDEMRYDPKSKREEPRWFGVDVLFKERLPRVVALSEIKAQRSLREMKLLKVSRLSVCPVTPAEWRTVLGLARRGDRGVTSSR